MLDIKRRSVGGGVSTATRDPHFRNRSASSEQELDRRQLAECNCPTLPFNVEVEQITQFFEAGQSAPGSR
jgi:hypothetical protein